MQLAMIGLGRMGANMVRRLLRAGVECVVYDAVPEAAAVLADEGARAASSPQELVSMLRPSCAIWMMLPAGAVGAMLGRLAPLLTRGDIVVDGGNSDHRLAIARSRELAAANVHLLDVGVSGGIWGLQEGYCLMVGGASEAVARLQPAFDALTNTHGTTEAKAWLHCGPSGAGHFVKMVHNAVEYALMAAYAEGFNLLRHARGGQEYRTIDAETAPLADAAAYQYDFDVPAIAELWRRGSVVRSWLLDLTAQALRDDPGLERFAGNVSDSGEGRWALKAAVDLSVPAPALAGALFSRFSSRGEDDYANRLLSAMREQFGGHTERR